MPSLRRLNLQSILGLLFVLIDKLIVFKIVIINKL